MSDGLVEIADAAIDHDGKSRMGGLEPIDAPVVERGDVAILARRQTVEPGLARMHDERRDPGRFDGARERLERLLRILLVDADAALDSDRHLDPALHGGDAFAHEAGLSHQAGAEAALLHAVGGTADIQIDLVVAEFLGNARAFGKLARIGAAELERHRTLGRIERHQPRAVAVQHSSGGDHLRIDQRTPRQQAMEEAAMPVRPFHHGRDGETTFLVLQGLCYPWQEQRSGRCIPNGSQAHVHYPI